MKLVQYSIAFAAVLIGGVAMATETSMSDSVTAKGSLRISDAAETVRRQRCCRRQSAPVCLFHLILTCLVCCVCSSCGHLSKQQLQPEDTRVLLTSRASPQSDMGNDNFRRVLGGKVSVCSFFSLAVVDSETYLEC